MNPGPTRSTVPGTHRLPPARLSFFAELAYRGCMEEWAYASGPGSSCP